MAHVYGLFCACCPDSGIRYVGQTTQPLKQRLYQHRTDGCRPVTLWSSTHEVQIVSLEQGPEEGLGLREGFWIRVFDTYNTGFNRVRTATDPKRARRTMDEVAVKVNLGDFAVSIVDDLTANPGSAPAEIAARIGRENKEVGTKCGELVASGRLVREGRGKYRVAGSTSL